MERLIVIDGNSLLYRAFYAMPPLHNAKGEPTNAVYGFLNMLFKLIQDYHPTYIAVAFDKAGPTFRHQKFTEYKATRKPMPQDLVPQIAMLKNTFDIMKVACFELSGFEADDILGTFSKQAEEQDIACLIVTGDRDALQLVSEKTHVLLTKRGITETEYVDVKHLQEKWGLTPSQMIDLKGLMGDASDNIKGVPGVGEKTALQLIQQFGSIQGLYARINEVASVKLHEKLVAHKENAIQSYELVTIERNAPITVEWDMCKLVPPQGAALAHHFMALGFKSLMNKILNAEEGEVSTQNSKAVMQDIANMDIFSINDLNKMIEKLGQTIAVWLDVDAVWLCSDKQQFRIGFKSGLLDDGLDEEETMMALRPLWEDSRYHKVLYNAKQFKTHLSQFGFTLCGRIDDVMLQAYLLNGGVGDIDPTTLLLAYGVETEKMNAYALMMMFQTMEKDLKDQEMYSLYQQVEMPLVQVLFDMEQEGFSVDVSMLHQLKARFDENIQDISKQIYKLAGEEFNVNSPKQLGDILFDRLKLPHGKKTQTGYSTDIAVLEKIEEHHPIIAEVMQYRQIMKLNSTYVEGLLHAVQQKTGKIHTTFQQAITSTGRISSTAPNLQNIPIRTELGRNLRKVFIARDENHVLIDADYSQIELRILAHVSGDERLMNAFIRGEDVHTSTASEIFGIPMQEVTQDIRSKAKAVNFGIIYGISGFGLATNIGISKNEAGKYIDMYLSRYFGVRKYMEDIVHIARKQGYVETLLHRRRYLPELASTNYVTREFGKRVALNTPIQGTAADIIKMAMIRVRDAICVEGLNAKLILQVHDELIIDTPIEEVEKVKILIKQCMESVIKLSVPLVADVHIGKNWFDAK